MIGEVLAPNPVLSGLSGYLSSHYINVDEWPLQLGQRPFGGLSSGVGGDPKADGRKSEDAGEYEQTQRKERYGVLHSFFPKAALIALLIGCLVAAMLLRLLLPGRKVLAADGCAKAKHGKR